MIVESVTSSLMDLINQYINRALIYFFYYMLKTAVSKTIVQLMNTILRLLPEKK